MVIPPAQRQKHNDRRNQPRTTLVAPLVPLATLRARVDKERSGDYYFLHNGRCLLAYRDSYQEHGFKSFKALFAHVTGQRATAVSSNDLARRLRPARLIAPEEAWESALGPSALCIIRHHTKEERAVFFALGRRVARARSAGQRPQAPATRALRALSDEVLKIEAPTERVALLQARLQISPAECVAPLVPKSEQDQPREAPPPATLVSWVNGLVGAAGYIASRIAEVRHALEGHEGAVPQDILRKLDSARGKLGGEVLANLEASYQLAAKAQAATVEPVPASRPKKKRPAAAPAPVVTPPPAPESTATPAPPPASAAAQPTPPSPPEATSTATPASAAPSPTAEPGPVAEPEPPVAVDHAPPAAQIIVAGGTPPAWVRAEWLVLVAALNVLLNDEEVYRLNDLLQMLALEKCNRYANHEELQELIDGAQQREGALPASVVPHYKRWLEWVGALNVRARHYLCVAMIVGLRRSQWRSLIYTMRYGDLPKDMHDDIVHAGNTIPEPFQKWRRANKGAEKDSASAP